MSDTFHIKRFNEYAEEFTDFNRPEAHDQWTVDVPAATRAMIEDLALALEQEHEARVALEKRLEVIEELAGVEKDDYKVTMESIKKGIKLLESLGYSAENPLFSSPKDKDFVSDQPKGTNDE